MCFSLSSTSTSTAVQQYKTLCYKHRINQSFRRITVSIAKTSSCTCKNLIFFSNSKSYALSTVYDWLYYIDYILLYFTKGLWVILYSVLALSLVAVMMMKNRLSFDVVVTNIWFQISKVVPSKICQDSFFWTRSIGSIAKFLHLPLVWFLGGKQYSPPNLMKCSVVHSVGLGRRKY